MGKKIKQAMLKEHDHTKQNMIPSLSLTKIRHQRPEQCQIVSYFCNKNNERTDYLWYFSIHLILHAY